MALLTHRALGYQTWYWCNCAAHLHFLVIPGYWRLTHGHGEAVRDFTWDDMWVTGGTSEEHLRASPPVMDWLDEVHRYEGLSAVIA